MICNGKESSDDNASATAAVEGMNGSRKSDMPQEAITGPAVGRLSQGTTGTSVEEKSKALDSSLSGKDEAKTDPAAEPEKEEEEEEEETAGEMKEMVFKALNQNEDEKQKALKRSSKKMKFAIATEWVVFFYILAWLITGLTEHGVSGRHTTVWGLETWKWSVLALAVFDGRLAASQCLCIIVFPIKKDLLRGQNKFLYFINRLRRKLKIFLWLGLILAAWGS